MGMDLTLYPHNGPIQDWQIQFGRDALDLDRQYEIFAQIDQKVMGDGYKVKQVCTPKSLPPNVKFWHYEDEGVKERRTDSYGAPLTYVEARELKNVKLAKASKWNKAAFSMIKELPDSYPVVLMWH